MRPAYVRYFGEARGFTLIELLISVTIIILLSGTSLVAFVNYREVRSVSDEANAVAERLRTIQIKATAVEVPVECVNGVTNYKVTYGGTSLSVVATCPGVVDTAIGNLTLSLAGSVFQNSGTIIFDSRSVSALAIPADICLGGSGNIYKITVNQAANVSRPAKVAVCP